MLSNFKIDSLIESADDKKPQAEGRGVYVWSRKWAFLHFYQVLEFYIQRLTSIRVEGILPKNITPENSKYFFSWTPDW